MKIAACLTSITEHYCTPPVVDDRVHATLVPRGSGRTLIDAATNGAAITRPNFYCDGTDGRDGLTAAWDIADTWYNNCPYGTEIKKWVERQAHWGRTMGLPGIALLPARVDTEWCREYVFKTADAWLFLDGRLAFWLPIPLERSAASGDYYLKKWYPWATDDNLPSPFRSLSPGFAVGPELGKTGKPQSAPFPSMIAFYADQTAEEMDPRDEREALRELVRTAGESVLHERAKTTGEEVLVLDQWEAEAERLLGSAYFNTDGPLDLAAFARIAERSAAQGDHPITVREFARHFLSLGTLIVARGPHRGVWRA